MCIFQNCSFFIKFFKAQFEQNLQEKFTGNKYLFQNKPVFSLKLNLNISFCIYFIPKNLWNNEDLE